MPPRRRWTIKEVAEAAGVSTQTVSRVLNNRPDVAPKTFQRVQQVIADTGYSPNVFARSLTQGRSRILGVVAFGLEYFGPSRILTGIEEEAAEMGYSITLNLTHRPETDDVDRLLSSLMARQVDGIIWAVPEVGDNRAWSHALSQELAVPVALVGGMAGQTPLTSIGIDNRAIGQLATEHQLAGGARKVGIITGPSGWWEAQQRQHGWREILEAHGMTPGDDLIVEGDWTANSGEQGLYRLLEQAPDVDAVFASNDQMALGVLHVAHRLGRRVPDDLAVVGVDNISESSHFWPALTTVHQPLREAGALAVRDIVGSLGPTDDPRPTDEPATSPSTLLRPELVVRESSRAVARP